MGLKGARTRRAHLAHVVAISPPSQAGRMTTHDHDTRRRSALHAGPHDKSKCACRDVSFRTHHSRRRPSAKPLARLARQALASGAWYPTLITSPSEICSASLTEITPALSHAGRCRTATAPRHSSDCHTHTIRASIQAHPPTRQSHHIERSARARIVGDAVVRSPKPPPIPHAHAACAASPRSAPARRAHHRRARGRAHHTGLTDKAPAGRRWSCQPPPLLLLVLVAGAAAAAAAADPPPAAADAAAQQAATAGGVSPVGVVPVCGDASARSRLGEHPAFALTARPPTLSGCGRAASPAEAGCGDG